MRAWQIGPSFRRLWLATTAANVGDGLGKTALPLLAASLSRDPLVVAGVSAAALSGLVFTLPFGALLYHLDRRALLLGAHAARGLLLVLLADGVAETLVPSLVERDALHDANAALYATHVTSNELVGLPLGGLLFAALPALPFVVNAASLLASITLIATLPPLGTPLRVARVS